MNGCIKLVIYKVSGGFALFNTLKKVFEPKLLFPCPVVYTCRIKPKEKTVSCECGSWFCIISDLMDLNKHVNPFK